MGLEANFLALFSLSMLAVCGFLRRNKELNNCSLLLIAIIHSSLSLHIAFFKLESDTSEWATGTVLSMLCEDGKWHPCAFISKSLSPAERNYDIYDQEMLAIIRALKEWRHFLEGTPHTVKL